MELVSVNISAARKDTPKPFVLKLKAKNIKICQSCHKDYDGSNDTLGLVVARAERRLVSNLSTQWCSIPGKRKQFALPCSQSLPDEG